ncbi:MAG: hypothetical protein FJX75_03145 [Armatimonadetes bacterium]|nr:hypothetical protein [Armatimonadota bacterium]
MSARSGARGRSGRTWRLAPQSGGQKIPATVQERVRQRVLACAEDKFAGKYSRLDIRFRGAFCYIDAYQEPELPPGFPWPGCTETPDEYLDRMRDTPLHLCRLTYLGSEDTWAVAMYTYSGERYEPCVFYDGSMTGPPEDAFLLIAQLYLQ